MESVRIQMVNDEKRRPHSWYSVQRAGFQIMIFNRTLEDQGIFKNIIDYERHLSIDDEDFVIEGVLDMIYSKGSNIIIWDYKSANDPR